MSSDDASQRPKEITLAWLMEPFDGIHGIPQEHVDIFRQEWGESGELTRANLRRAAELGLHCRWLAVRLLPEAELARFRELAHIARAEMEREATAANAEHVAKAHEPSPGATRHHVGTGEAQTWHHPWQHSLHLLRLRQIHDVYARAIADTLADALSLP